MQALEPIFKAMMEAAMANAVKDGRDAINEKDLEAIDRRRHTAIKEVLRHNGRDTKEIGLFPDSK